MRFLACVVLLLANVSALGVDSSAYDSIDKDAVIIISSYDRSLHMYKVNILHEAVGPNYTSLRFLRRAIDALADEEGLASHPESIIGNQYPLDRDLILYSEETMIPLLAKKKPEKPD